MSLLSVLGLQVQREDRSNQKKPITPLTKTFTYDQSPFQALGSQQNATTLGESKSAWKEI